MAITCKAIAFAVATNTNIVCMIASSVTTQEALRNYENQIKYHFAIYHSELKWSRSCKLSREILPNNRTDIIMTLKDRGRGVAHRQERDSTWKRYDVTWRRTGKMVGIRRKQMSTETDRLKIEINQRFIRPNYTQIKEFF